MDIIEQPKTNVVIDATFLSNIMKCGRYTQFTHDLHLQPIAGKSNSLEIGSIIHKFMEVYYKSQKNGIGKNQAFGFGIAAAELYIQGCQYCTAFVPECTIEQDILEGKNPSEHIHNEKCQLKPKCGHPPNEYPGISNTPMESEGYLIGWKFALETCDQYHKFYSNDHWLTIDTEVVRSKQLYEDDEIRILWKSKLDWIVDTNQGIYPCDHKTMKQNRDTLSINNQFMGQCSVMGTRNVFINKIGLQKTLKPEEKFKRVTIPYTAARLLEFQSYVLPYWVKQLIQWNEQGHYPPNFQSCENKYGRCSFCDVCGSDPDMRNELLNQGFVVGSEWNPTNPEE